MHSHTDYILRMGLSIQKSHFKHKCRFYLLLCRSWSREWMGQQKKTSENDGMGHE